MGSVFINYGVKAGGGPPFLKRTRTAYGQIQTRTRSGSSYSQRQRQDGTCSCVATGPFKYYIWSTISCSQSGYQCDWYYGNPVCGTLPVPNSYVEGECCYSPLDYSATWSAGWPSYGLSIYDAGCYSYSSWPIHIAYYSNRPESCSGSYGGWYNVSSCNPDTNCAYNGRGLRNCRTLTGCNWGGWSGWSNVSSCSPSSNCSSNGGRECQTIYLWNAWSAWEEAETCTPQTPNAANGAVQIECQAI